MDTEIRNKQKISKPDFGKIFLEMAQRNSFCESKINKISSKKNWDSLDIIEINEKLFKTDLKFNQNHKAYDVSSIKKILNYQKEYNLNNSEMMRLFKISRNTIVKWQKLFNNQ